MRMTFISAGLALCAVLPLDAQAPRLTLAEARAMAGRASPDLAAARQAHAAALGRAAQAGAFPNPVLAYGREQTSGDGTEGSQDVVSLEQRLDLFGQRGARRAAAESHGAAAAARLDAAVARVDYEVARNYAAAAAAGRRAQLADEAAQAFGRAVRVSGERLAGGDVSGYQHRRLRLEAARYTARRLEALVARDSTLRTLGSLTGLDPVAFVLGDSLPPAPLALSADSLVALALIVRAELRAARLEAQAAEAEARFAAAERIPIPAVSAGYKTEEAGTGARLDGFVVGVSMAIPLWDRRAGAVTEARAESARRVADVEALRLQTVRDVHTAFDAVQSFAGQLAALGAELGEEARKARRAAEAAYAEGEIGLLEWLDSVRAYHDAESAYITVWAEYVARRAALERITSAPLF
jgi:cobalt-zinc-cadmium efflux system outer membrane protein